MIAIFVLTIETNAQEDMNATPFSFEAVEDGTVLTITNNNSVNIKFVFSSPSGSEDVWYTIQHTNEVILNAGDILILYSNCKDQRKTFNITASKDVYVYGNPLSLVSQSDYKTMVDLSNYSRGVLEGLFDKGWNGNPHIKNHPTKDIVLPPTILKEDCYSSMFNGCTNLTRAPKLPATIMTFRCYYHMFSFCSSLIAAPELPATTLADECYYAMFYACKSLTTAPALPAMELAYSCYDNMFRECTGLTAAPDLLAPKLETSCYYYMFNSCKNLSYVKCLATDISAGSCTGSWLVGVAPTGTFVKADDMNDWTDDYRGIPESWTVKNASEMPSGVGTTLINNEQRTANNVYDLLGRHMEQPVKGLCIKNGKKTMKH